MYPFIVPGLVLQLEIIGIFLRVISLCLTALSNGVTGPTAVIVCAFLVGQHLDLAFAQTRLMCLC